MSAEHAVLTKRPLPFNKTIKIVLLGMHYVGFSVWYGGSFFEVESLVPFPGLTTLSGVLLTARELYREGWAWLLTGEGICTWVKVLVLAAGLLVGRFEVVILSVVLLLGILSAELPDPVRKRRLLGTLHPR